MRPVMGARINDLQRKSLICKESETWLYILSVEQKGHEWTFYDPINNRQLLFLYLPPSWSVIDNTTHFHFTCILGQRLGHNAHEV